MAGKGVDVDLDAIFSRPRGGAPRGAAKEAASPSSPLNCVIASKSTANSSSAADTKRKGDTEGHAAEEEHTLSVSRKRRKLLKAKLAKKLLAATGVNATEDACVTEASANEGVKVETVVPETPVVVVVDATRSALPSSSALPSHAVLPQDDVAFADSRGLHSTIRT
jgi:hypothetical protein